MCGKLLTSVTLSPGLKESWYDIILREQTNAERFADNLASVFTDLSRSLNI
jgi:hypothetical protein